jgi:hypothetical protein
VYVNSLLGTLNAKSRLRYKNEDMIDREENVGPLESSSSSHLGRRRDWNGKNVKLNLKDVTIGTETVIMSDLELRK